MRKILIVPIGEVKNFYAMAEENLISEVVEGVPPFLKDIYTSEQLPVIHIEDDITPSPSEIDIMGQQLVEKDLQILELQQENQLIGHQLVDIDLRLLAGGM